MPCKSCEMSKKLENSKNIGRSEWPPGVSKTEPFTSGRQNWRRERAAAREQASTVAQTSISGETALQIHRESLKTSRLPFLPTGAKRSALLKRQTSQPPEKRHMLHYPEKSLRQADIFSARGLCLPWELLAAQPASSHGATDCPCPLLQAKPHHRDNIWWHSKRKTETFVHGMVTLLVNFYWTFIELIFEFILKCIWNVLYWFYVLIIIMYCIDFAMNFDWFIDWFSDFERFE